MAEVLYGRENLAAFFAAQVEARATGEPIRIHIVGDSKVAGVGASFGYRLQDLLPLAANGYPLSVTAEGMSGENSYIWANGEAADFLAEQSDVDLLIVNFGTNERVASSTGGPQTVAQTQANHIAAIDLIRASRPASELSILLLGQTPANNWQPGYNQTTEVMLEVNATLLYVAEETNSAYFDTTGLFRRAHAEAGWMEQLPTPTYGGGNVHPGDPLNMVLVGELGSRLFPLDFVPAPSGYGSTTPALLNGWSIWAGQPIYGPRATLRDGVVQLDGVIKPGVTAAYTTMFVLPPGYRPPVHRFFKVSTSNALHTVEVQVLSSGHVRIGTGYNGIYVALDAIRFRVD